MRAGENTSPEQRAAEARRLADDLEAYVARHGLSSWRVADYLFHGARDGIRRLRLKKRPTERVLARIRDFLASDPPPGLHRRPQGGPRKRRDCSTGVYLAERIEAFIAEHDLKPWLVSLHVFNSPHTLKRLRTRKPHPATVAKVEAFLANPDIAALREPPKKKAAPAPVIRLPQPARRPMTFDEQLAAVLSGRARVVRKLVMPVREHEFTLAGVGEYA